ALIAHRDQRRATVGGELEIDRLARAEPSGAEQEVGEELLEAPAIPLALDARLAMEDHAGAHRRQPLAVAHHDLAGDIAEVDALERNHRLPVGEARDFLELLDDRAQALDVPDQRRRGGALVAPAAF